MTTDLAAIEKRLKERRDYLNRALHQIEDTLDEPPSKDFEDRATERETDEVMESLGNTGLVEIRQIDAALARIADGTYGVCVACGEDIAPERLELVPHAARCRNCA